GDFAPTADVVLPSRVYHYRSIHIPEGVTVRASGTGVLELLSRGDVTIHGTIDVSGGPGGAGVFFLTMTLPNPPGGNGGGGETGTTVPGAAGNSNVCAPGGAGGVAGAPGSPGNAPCAPGGAFGGGAGGRS